MPRVFPLTFREAIYAQESPEEVPIVLVEATHPDLPSPARLSSDPTTRISLDPLVYGTIHMGDQYLWVLMTAILPSEDEESTPALQLNFEDVEGQVGDVLRSFQYPATIKLMLVSSKSLDTPLEVFTDLQTVKSEGDAHQCTLDISREWFIAEPSPAHRFTKPLFPGLHR
jgi:hypothetical protein